MATFSTITTANRSRPALLAVFAHVISTDNPRIRAEDVCDNTRILSSQVAIFEIRLRRLQLLDDSERIKLGSTVGEILDQIVR